MAALKKLILIKDCFRHIGWTAVVSMIAIEVQVQLIMQVWKTLRSHADVGESML